MPAKRHASKFTKGTKKRTRLTRDQVTALVSRRLRRYDNLTELKDSGLRQDFLFLADELLEYRNYISHDMLADDAFMRHIAGARAGRFAEKRLDKGLFIVESVIVVHDFLFGGD